MRSLELQFEAPPVGVDYDKSTATFVSNLIGHEGSGSILSLLKACGWANSLSSGQHTASMGYEIFSVSIELTVAGLAQVDQVVALVFAYVRLLDKQVYASICINKIDKNSIYIFTFAVHRERRLGSTTSSRLSMNCRFALKVANSPHHMQHRSCN